MLLSRSLSALRAALLSVAATAATLAVGAAPVAVAQTTDPQAPSQPQITPALQGTFLADPAGPGLVSTAPYGSSYFVVNKDLSLLRRSSALPSLKYDCAAPTGLSASSTAPRTQLNDSQSVYLTAGASGSANAAAVAVVPGIPCGFSAPVALAGGTPTQTLSSNDPKHSTYYVVNAFNGNGPDTLTTFYNLNASGNSSPTLTQRARVSLDTGAQYTSVVSDTSGLYGLTAITELKTATSPGNLWVYSPGIQTAFKILGPGGAALPAVTSFILPPLNDGGGSLLVLVNQDNLTASNLASPPAVTSPFTIIDLGPLQRSFSAVVARGTTVTLPFVTQIAATASYYAMLGAVYNPVNHLLYAVVGGGTGTSNVVESVYSYDPRTPAAPKETLVADVSAIPFTFGSYPQLALNAAAGSLQILTGSPAAVYSTGISGSGNTAIPVPGTVFPDTSYSPVAIASSTLLGETYIASSAQVDILTKPTTAQLRATVEINSSDTAIVGQSFALYGTTLYPVGDAALIAAPITITATPADGSAPFTFASRTVGDFAYPGGAVYDKTFAAPGVYTLQASVPATANYPAFTSLPISVTVSSSGYPGVYPTKLAIAAPSNSTSTAVAVTVTLTGSTYAPTGRIVVSDATAGEVGRATLSGGTITIPLTVNTVLAQGTSKLTATYNGDDQNQPSTSNTVTVNVGASKITPTLALSVPATANAGSSVTGTVTLSTGTGSAAPTGTVTIQSIPSGSTTPTTLTTVPAAAGASSISFTAPAAGSYTLLASYAGDANYNSATGTTPLTVASSKSTPTLTLTIPTTSTAGAQVTGTVALDSSSNPNASPSGTITVQAVAAGSTTPVTLTSLSSSPGTSSIAFTAPASGNYTVTATYSGNASFNAATSNPAPLQVNAAVRGKIALDISFPATATQGATVAGSVGTTQSGQTATPTGTVYLTAQSAATQQVIQLASFPAANAKTTLLTLLSFTAPASGTYALQATYAGDANFDASTSNITTLTVYAAGPTTTTLNLSAPSNTLFNTPFDSYVTIKPKDTLQQPITGNITLVATSAGGTNYTLGSVPASQATVAGTAKITGTLATPGAYTLTAGYPGDANYGASTASIGIRIDSPPAAAATTLKVTAPTLVHFAAGFSVNVALTAPGASSTTAPSGNVEVYLKQSISNAFIGKVSAAQAFASGGVAVPLQVNYAGPQTLIVTYAGDINYAGSSDSAPITFTYKPSLLLTGTATGSTGQAQSFKVAFDSASSAPTGSITISSTANGTAGPSTTVPAASAVATGGAAFSLTFPAPGVYTLVANYPGDTQNEAATTTYTTTISTPGAKADIALTLDDPTTGDYEKTQLSLRKSGTPISADLTLTALLYAGDVQLSGKCTNPNLSVVFKDASGANITKLTAKTGGAHFKVFIGPGSYTGSAQPFLPGTRTVVLAGGLLMGLFALRLRRTRMRSVRLLSAVLLLAGMGGAITGCGPNLGCESDYTTGAVVVTATPLASTNGNLPVTVQVDFYYDKLYQPLF